MPRPRLRLICAALTVVVTALAAPAASADRSASALRPPTAGVTGPLTTAGNQVLDGTGRPVVLRGVATEWLNHMPSTYPGGELDGADIDAARTWGATVYRVYLGSHYWNEPPHSCHPRWKDYRATVERVVDRITAAGMVALLDLHWNTSRPCTKAGQQQMADQSALPFWKSVATAFRDNPLVAFDLYNEPHGISWDVWRDGELAHAGGLPAQLPRKVGMQEMHDVVRATGAQNLVFVSGNDFATSPPPDTHLLDGVNVVYAVHYYTCPDSLPEPQGDCTTTNPYDPSPRLTGWVRLAARHPVVLTEFGWGDPSDGRYVRNTIAWAERHRIGWIAMDFAHTGPGFNLGLYDALGSFRPTPGPGRAVFDALARSARPRQR